jgi:molybdopterin synthase sulfur carrier subunit
VAVRIRWFAQAREAAGTGSEEGRGSTVAEVLADAVARHGGALAAIIDCSAVWVDGEPAQPADPVGPQSEVAVLPPVSGG